MTEQQNIRDDIASTTHEWRDHAIDGTPLGDRPICNCYDYADHMLASPVIRRIQADAWDTGWLRGFADCDGEYEKADNPYREGATDGH